MVQRELVAKYNEAEPHTVAATGPGKAAASAIRIPVFVAPFDGRILGVDLNPEVTIAAAPVNYWTFKLKNGATEITAAKTNAAGGGLSSLSRNACTVNTSGGEDLVAAGAVIVMTGTSGLGAQDLSTQQLGVTVRFTPR